MSWTSVDYIGRWKALHYFVREAFKPVLSVIYREGAEIKIAIANDQLETENHQLEVTLYDFSGKILWQKSEEIELAGNRSKIYMSLSENELLLKGNPSQILLEVKVSSNKNTVAENLFYFRDVKALLLEKPAIEKSIEKMGDNNYAITLKCNTLAKNVTLSTASEGRFSNNYFDMLPGKTYQINFTGAADDLTKNLEIKTLHQTFAH